MTLRLATGTGWDETLRRAMELTPEGFADDRLRNLVEGDGADSGTPSPLRPPVDGTVLVQLPRLDAETASRAVRYAAQEHRTWSGVALAERVARVEAALDALTEARDLLAMLLVWEIGKPWRLARADVDRALDGVRWYVTQIERQLADREPLPGPVSNIASWNYRMSVLVHAELIQLLAGNAVIAKTPSQGGAVCLTVAHALMRRAGLPVTLLSGSGEELSEVLVRAPEIGAVAFVGGRSNGGKGAAARRRGGLADGAGFREGQDPSAYVAPATLLAPPGRSRLMHAEPFGPVDTIVVVDTEEELLAAMNASNGALVASLACDDEELATKLAKDLQAFKVGINKPRSRGDREEPFGGRGASWKGAFVGGDLLLEAVTVGDGDARLYGNFPEYSRYPQT